jgi:molybdenum cofactor cytidylyltransferase
MDNIWAIILAAGASTRMKQQKLLLPFGGKTIIETVTQKAMSVAGNQVVVVLGADREEVKRQIGQPGLKYVVNENYTDGMLSSVICGFRALPESAGAALLFLGDQPQVPEGIAERLIEFQKTSGKGIVLPVFQGRRGHPVLIDTRYAPEIEKLDPTKGLKMLMVNNNHDVSEVEFEDSAILKDIDTPEDYQNAINKNQ